ncbi:uncharacterized protein V6R79_010490 [Siganus canaliculatus]
MAVNSSSSSVSLFSEMLHCYSTTVARTSILIFTSTNILVLLPLYIFIICLLLQRRRQQRPGTTSQTDVFTYNMVATELMGIVGSSLICCGAFVQLPLVIMIGALHIEVNIGGQVLFHTLTCVERYLAVVHPITYRNLGMEKGIMIRNFSIACAWIVNFMWTTLLFVRNQMIIITFSVFSIAFAFATILFCSLSVLYALIRPVPGEGGGDKQRLDQSKLKAFCTITEINGEEATGQSPDTETTQDQRDQQDQQESTNYTNAMAVNSSSSSVSVFSEMLHCYNTTVARTSILIFTSTNLLVLLPLYIFIICLLLQRRRQQRPGATSQTDVFTYNMVATELMGIVGSSLICCGAFVQLPLVIMIGALHIEVNIGGQVLFHTLTCVERYLAVVHPITYRNLGMEKGIMIRNFSIACAWIVNFMWTTLLFVRNQMIIITFSVFSIAFAFATILFCSLSVLYALIRPVPGEGGGDKQRLDQSKLKAFCTITIHLTLLHFLPTLTNRPSDRSENRQHSGSSM